MHKNISKKQLLTQKKSQCKSIKAQTQGFYSHTPLQLLCQIWYNILQYPVDDEVFTVMDFKSLQVRFHF